MLTSFGKTLRKLRIDNEELLKDMALKLGVTLAYLSAVETGKREIPDTWVSIIAREYALNYEEEQELQEKADLSKKVIKLDVGNLDDEAKRMVVLFAKRFKDLSQGQIFRINKILEDKGNDD